MSAAFNLALSYLDQIVGLFRISFPQNWAYRDRFGRFSSWNFSTISDRSSCGDDDRGSKSSDEHVMSTLRDNLLSCFVHLCL